MSWKIDGRHGAARVGDLRRHGFALMHDEGRQLIAFHALPDDAYGLNPAEPSPMDQFVINAGDFEPASA
ncbi:MAG: hypothetical protein ACYDB4_16260 [Candidatus Dormibacteraceae bacterium]